MATGTVVEEVAWELERRHECAGRDGNGSAGTDIDVGYQKGCGWGSDALDFGVGGKEDMESVRECPSSVLLLLLALSLMFAVSAEELFLGKPNQGSAWELPLQHAAPCDHFSLVCGEEKGDNFKSSGLEADFNILSEGDPPIEKEPLCTVNCFRADP